MDNTFKVPQRQWRKWKNDSRAVFNSLYELMVNNQKLFLHPLVKPVESKHWKTTAWNAAWEAADAVRGLALKRGDTVVDYKRGKPSGRSITVQ